MASYGEWHERYIFPDCGSHEVWVRVCKQCGFKFNENTWQKVTSRRIYNNFFAYAFGGGITKGWDIRPDSLTNHSES